MMSSPSDVSVYVAALLFVGFFAAAAISDIKCRLIPDLCPAGLLLSGGLRVLSGAIGITAAGAGLVLIGGMALALSLWRDSMGGGDVKLIGAASFAVGPVMSVYALIIAVSAALVYALGKKLARRSAAGIPLAPFLLAGYAAIYFCEVLI